MNRKVSMMKSIVVAVALAAGVSGIAHADDSSMSRFGGDSYAYFNSIKPSNAPSAWRQANPNGLPERQLQALSSEALANDFQQLSFDKAPSTFHQTRPNGLSERELQALSSEGAAWHSTPRLATTALASTNGAARVTTAAR
jgi:hypothetical protein